MEQVLVKVMNSKEFEKLKKCNEKNCPKMLEIIKKQQVIVKKITKLLETQNKLKSSGATDSKSLKKFVDNMINVMKSVEELTALNMNKKAILCNMSKCANELADVQILQNNFNKTFVEETRKKLEGLGKTR